MEWQITLDLKFWFIFFPQVTYNRYDELEKKTK